MNRIVINKINLEQINTFDCVLLDCQNIDSVIKIKSNIDILIVNTCSVYFEITNSANVKFSFLEKGNMDNVFIKFDLFNKSSLDVYFADFSSGKENVNITVNLNDEKCSAKWHLASLSSNDDSKEFNVNVYHNAPSTYALSDNYGVCKDNAKLVFSGVSYILNGCSLSKTRQNAKIMEFDRFSRGIAKPILKIDENNIEASHGAVVGKINDEHLFYLMSRGLSENEAKTLITYGYLKPIMNGFVEQEYKDEISELIEGRM